jgi:streptogramin lyase
MRIQQNETNVLTPVNLARLAALLLIAAAIASAQQVAINEYPIPTPDSNANQITLGPDGALWFTERNSSIVASITTAGVITEYPVAPNSEPYAITTGPDGALWFVEQTGPGIGRITTSGAVTDYPVPGASFGVASAITTGPDGALWFAEHWQQPNWANHHKLEQSLSTVVPTANSGPFGSQPDRMAHCGSLETYASKIGRITTAGVTTEYPVPTANSQPGGIVTGPDGALWFAEDIGNKIGRITTAGTFTEYAVPTANSYPNWIAAGDDGALWFTEAERQQCCAHHHAGCRY